MQRVIGNAAGTASVIDLVGDAVLDPAQRARAGALAVSLGNQALTFDQAVAQANATAAAQAAARRCHDPLGCIWNGIKKAATNKYVVIATTAVGGLALAATGVGLFADAAIGGAEGATLAGVSTETISSAADAATATSAAVDGVGCFAAHDAVACGGLAANVSSLGLGRVLLPVLGGAGTIAGGLTQSGTLATALTGGALDFTTVLRAILGNG